MQSGDNIHCSLNVFKSFVLMSGSKLNTICWKSNFLLSRVDPATRFCWRKKEKKTLLSVIEKPPPINSKIPLFLLNGTSIHLNSSWKEDVIRAPTARGGAVKCHALSRSSVKQIKGGICLYCASKSSPPLTADTSHVDEGKNVYGGPRRFVSLEGDVMQIKQTVCDFHRSR